MQLSATSRICVLTILGLFTMLRMHAEDLAFKIDNCKTHVSIASVNLSVSELTEVDGSLVGDYEIIVPLQKSKNETGRIVLPLSASVSELRVHGGTLQGHAYSSKEDKPPNTIVCEIIPAQNQAIRLAITTSKRTLRFQSRYTIIGDQDS